LRALAAEPDPPTTVRNPDEAVRQHVADSLSGLELEEVRSAKAIVDIGAGAGFPGLVLAAALPRARVDLVEATRRKVEVIERLARAAALANARAIATRAEEWGAAAGHESYDLVTARALAPLGVLVEYAAPLLVEGGTLVAWKGARDERDERGGAAAAQQLGFEPAGVVRVEPFEGARNRHLHAFRKISPTPPGFPRRPGMASKRPLA